MTTTECDVLNFHHVAYFSLVGEERRIYSELEKFTEEIFDH